MSVILILSPTVNPEKLPLVYKALPANDWKSKVELGGIDKVPVVVMEVGKNVIDPVRTDIGESTNVVASLLSGIKLLVGFVLLPPPPFKAYDAVKA